MSYQPMPPRENSGAHIAVAWILTVFTGFYLLPWAIAATRNKENTGTIALLNVLLGWTGVGWIITLVMACLADPVRYGMMAQPPPMHALPPAPYGTQSPYAQSPYGTQNPYAQSPYAQNAYAQNPYGQDPYGQGYGQDPYGRPYGPPPRPEPTPAEPSGYVGTPSFDLQQQSPYGAPSANDPYHQGRP